MYSKLSFYFIQSICPDVDAINILKKRKRILLIPLALMGKFWLMTLVLLLQLCEELFEKINDNCNEEMSYSVEVCTAVG